MDALSQYLIAAALGVVQGIAEFLPISSSGHLVIGTALLRDAAGASFSPDDSLRLNVSLHVGSLFSIVWVFREKTARCCAKRAVVRGDCSRDAAACGGGTQSAAQTIETGVFHTPGCGMLSDGRRRRCFSLVIVGGAESTELPSLQTYHALGIGLFQAFAVLPGISRSGSTISGGLLLGLDPKILSGVLVPHCDSRHLGIRAVLLLMRDQLAESTTNDVFGFGPLLVGLLVSFVVGLVSLKWLLRLISTGRWLIFAWYCAAVGSATIVWQLAVRAA